VPSRRAEFWIKQVESLVGYDLYKPTKPFTAEPGAPATVTVTSAETATTPEHREAGRERLRRVKGHPDGH
jgi:hypothetical protein